MIASGVWAGEFDLDYGFSRADKAGLTIGEELLRIGYAGDVPAHSRPFKAAFEIHIGQGPSLEIEIVLVSYQDTMLPGCNVWHSATTKYPRRLPAPTRTRNHAQGDLKFTTRICPCSDSVAGACTAWPCICAAIRFEHNRLTITVLIRSW